MPEDKKDNKKSEKTEEKTAEIKVEKKEKIAKKAKPAKSKNEEVKKEIKGLEELPEDIKKKLEKKEQGNKGKVKKVVKKKKREKRRVTVGNAYIKATYNNTIVTLTDASGNVLSWASAGIAGFKGPKKATPYAAQIITRLAVGKAREEYGLEEVSVFIKGVGTGRESAVRALNNNGLNVTLIKDITPIPHNGCRVRKPRRV